MSSDAPPSFAELTTSLTWRDSVEVKTFTSSGMRAPASVPQEMIVASFHHWVASPPRLGMMREEPAYVSTIDTIEETDTSDLSDPPKFIFAAPAKRALASAAL